MDEKKKPSQRRFAVMGMNAYKILDKLTSNQRLCRLLKYHVKDPFDANLPDVVGEDMIGKQISITPFIYDNSTEKMSYLVAVFSGFAVTPGNGEFKQVTLRFDFVCPYDEWDIEAEAQRPYLIMQEIDSMFNEMPLAGIGNLRFLRGYPTVLSPQLGGYSMEYVADEFN